MTILFTFYILCDLSYNILLFFAGCQWVDVLERTGPFFVLKKSNERVIWARGSCLGEGFLKGGWFVSVLSWFVMVGVLIAHKRQITVLTMRAVGPL